MLKRILYILLIGYVFQNVNAASMQPLPYPIEQDLPVVVILNQYEMQVDVPDSSAVASQFGLLGALIGAAVDSTATKNAEARIAAIRNLMIDYNFNQKFEQAIRASLATPGIAVNPQITIARSTGEIANSIPKPRPAEVITNLTITPRYSISNDFETVSLTMTVQYISTTLKPNGKTKQAYNFSRIYKFNIPMDPVKGSQATEDSNRWAELGSKQLMLLADQSIKQVTDMFAFDFSTEGRALSAQSNKGLKVTFKGNTYSGRELRRTEDFVWVQSGKDWAQTIQGYQPITGIPTEAINATEKLDGSPSQTTLPAVAEGKNG